MKRRRAPESTGGLQRAFDEVRFAPDRTLNLRATLPTVAAAVTRAEKWLRQRQIDRAGEVLIITGRGKGSEGGVSLIRQGVTRLLHSLRRQGVISGYHEHTSGSLVVELAPVRALFESPRRRGSRGAPATTVNERELQGIEPATLKLLRQLALQTLEELGVHDAEAFVADEMRRQFSLLTRSMGAPADGDRLRDAIRSVLRD